MHFTCFSLTNSNYSKFVGLIDRCLQLKRDKQCIERKHLHPCHCQTCKWQHQYQWIVFLCNIPDGYVDSNVVKGTLSVWSTIQRCTSIPHERSTFNWSYDCSVIIFKNASKYIQPIHHWLWCGWIFPLSHLLCHHKWIWKMRQLSAITITIARGV